MQSRGIYSDQKHTQLKASGVISEVQCRLRQKFSHLGLNSCIGLVQDSKRAQFQKHVTIELVGVAYSRNKNGYWEENDSLPTRSIPRIFFPTRDCTSRKRRDVKSVMSRHHIWMQTEPLLSRQRPISYPVLSRFATCQLLSSHVLRPESLLCYKGYYFGRLTMVARTFDSVY